MLEEWPGQNHAGFAGALVTRREWSRSRFDLISQRFPLVTAERHRLHNPPRSRKRSMKQQIVEDRRQKPRLPPNEPAKVKLMFLNKRGRQAKVQQFFNCGCEH